jgi:hypothetical protein
MAPAPSTTDGLVARLEADGILRHDGDRARTTRRWQGAMARAAAQLVRSGEAWDDLRVPIASALVEIYGVDCPDAELVALIEVMTPIEAAELAPLAGR